MKTFNWNQRSVLYGALIITLALTKSWFFTTPVNAGHSDWAEQTTTPATARSSRIDLLHAGHPVAKIESAAAASPSGVTVTSKTEVSADDVCDPSAKQPIIPIKAGGKTELYQETCFIKGTKELNVNGEMKSRDVYKTSVTIFPCGTLDCGDQTSENMDIIATSVTDAKKQVQAQLLAEYKLQVDKENAEKLAQEKQDNCDTDENDKDLNPVEQMRCLGKNANSKKNKDDQMEILSTAEERIKGLLESGDPNLIAEAQRAAKALQGSLHGALRDSATTLVNFTRDYGLLAGYLAQNQDPRNSRKKLLNIAKIDAILSKWDRLNAVCNTPTNLGTSSGNLCSDGKNAFVSDLYNNSLIPEAQAAETTDVARNGTTNGITIDGIGARGQRIQLGRANNGMNGNNFNNNNNGFGGYQQNGNGINFNNNGQQNFQNQQLGSQNIYNPNFGANSYANTGSGSVMFQQNRQTVGGGMPIVNFGGSSCNPGPGYCQTGIPGRG